MLRIALRYVLALGAASAAVGACQLLRAVLHMGFGKSAMLAIAVAAVAWFLSYGPGIAAGGFGTALHYLVLRPLHPTTVETVLAAGVRFGLLLAIVLVVSSIKRWLRRVQFAAEIREAKAAQVAAQIALDDQARAEQLANLTLELRTLTGVIQLATETARTGGDAAMRPSQLDTLDDAAQHLSHLANRFGEISQGGRASASAAQGGAADVLNGHAT